MNKYIFITTNGVTIAPNNETPENFQVLGFANGGKSDEAFENFLKEYPNVREQGYDEIWCYPLGSETPVQYYYIQLDEEELEMMR